MNFNSNKAYDYFVKAKDTHKSWQAIQVLLVGAATRIHKREGRATISFSVFEWQADQEYNNLKLVSQLVLNYLLVIYIFKVGARHNDINLINSARFKFDDFFIYREVAYRDLKNRVLYDK